MELSTSYLLIKVYYGYDKHWQRVKHLSKSTMLNMEQSWKNITDLLDRKTSDQRKNIMEESVGSIPLTDN